MGGYEVIEIRWGRTPTMARGVASSQCLSVTSPCSLLFKNPKPQSALSSRRSHRASYRHPLKTNNHFCFSIPATVFFKLGNTFFSNHLFFAIQMLFLGEGWGNLK